MKIIRIVFTTTFALLALMLGALVFLQSRWTKDQIAEVLQEIALQEGIQLSIDQIEGELPLKWTLTNVHATLTRGDTIDIDRLQMRIALLPLLRGRLGVSYLHADHTTITYTPASASPGTFSFPPKIKGSFLIYSATFDKIQIINRSTEQEMTYSLKGRGHYLRGGSSLSLEASILSSEMNAHLFCEGSKRIDYLQTSLELTVYSEKAFVPFYTFPIQTFPGEIGFEMKSHSQGPWKTWKALLTGKGSNTQPPINGKVDMHVLKLALPNPELGLQTLELSSQFSLSANRSWNLSHLAILSPFMHLQGTAQFSSQGTPTQLQTSLALPNLSYFSPYLKGNASGELELRDEKGYLFLSMPEFTIDTTTFSQGKVELLAQFEKKKWTASLQMQADHPQIGYHACSDLIWDPKNIFEIKSFDLVSSIGRIVGDLTIGESNNITGGLSFQITDLKPLSELTHLELAGQLGGEIQIKDSELSARALGKHLKVDQFISSQVDLDLARFKLKRPFQGTLKVTSDEAYLREVYFNSFSYEMGWSGTKWDYSLQAQGNWKGPFDMGAHGSLSFSSNNFHLLCSELSGKVLAKKIALQNKCSFELSKDAFKIDTLDLLIDEGHFYLFSELNPSTAALRMSAHHFPLDFLTILSPRFSLKGLSSLDIDLQGTKNSLEGHLNILLEHADIYPAGSQNPIQTKGSLQAHLDNHIMQLHTHLVATEEQVCEFALSIPYRFELDPFKISFPTTQRIAGECTIEGHTEQLFDFINIGSQRVGGFLSCHLLLSGTLDSPIINGPLSVQGGFYENYFIGIAVKDADITAQARGHELIIEKAVTTDGEKGTSESSGVFHLTRGLPFSIAGNIHHFRVIRFDWLTGACSGPFTIEGNLTSALAKGKLTLDEADVTIPDQLPSMTPSLPITFINEPSSHLQKFHYSESYPFYYDLDVYGDHDLRLSGRGIEAELAGAIHMTGKNLSVKASGALHTQKGKFSFAGKDFTINQGEILFSEEKNFLNITSTVEYPNLTVTVHFRGDLRSPQLIFESNPSLPTSSILARILFNKDVSELSAGQAVQLANTIVTLSGSSGPNVLETIRKNLGVDRFSISVPATKESGYVAIEIGKYITEGVMISLIQSTTTSQVKVEVELKAGFVLEAQTQEDSQGKFSFKWNKNY